MENDGGAVAKGKMETIIEKREPHCVAMEAISE